MRRRAPNRARYIAFGTAARTGIYRRSHHDYTPDMIEDKRGTSRATCLWLPLFATAIVAAAVSQTSSNAREPDLHQTNSEEDGAEADYSGAAGDIRLEFAYTSAQFDSQVFGNQSDAAIARARLEKVLERKITAAYRICELTEVQREKLALAGRGDLKRLFDRIEKVKLRACRSHIVNSGDRRMEEEIDWLRQSVTSDLFGYGSLFDKTLRHNVSFEELVRYKRWETLNWHAR